MIRVLKLLLVRKHDEERTQLVFCKNQIRDIQASGSGDGFLKQAHETGFSVTLRESGGRRRVDDG